MAAHTLKEREIEDEHGPCRRKTRKFVTRSILETKPNKQKRAQAGIITLKKTHAVCEAWGGVGSIWELSVLCPQFLCKSKTVLKIKSIN